MTPKELSREIKFRAWDKEKKEMVVVTGLNLLTNTKDEYMPSDVYHMNTGEHYDVSLDHLELMQFTGLHDKNGKEIYEGDIVRVITDVEEGIELIMMIEWENGAFILLGQGWAIVLCEEERYSELKIIGNVYENLELLN